MVKLETLRADAAREYLADEANSAVAYPYSPARATAKIAKARGVAKGPLVGLVAEVYYRENGSRSPLPASATKGPKALASAVRTRRDAAGRLGRWEVVAYSAAARLGRPVSVAAAKALYVAAGGDLDSSYTGRGTREGAKATRASALAEVVAGLPADG